jgi:hypothetical protein
LDYITSCIVWQCLSGRWWQSRPAKSGCLN